MAGEISSDEEFMRDLIYSRPRPVIASPALQEQHQQQGVQVVAEIGSSSSTNRKATTQAMTDKQPSTHGGGDSNINNSSSSSSSAARNLASEPLRTPSVIYRLRPLVGPRWLDALHDDISQYARGFPAFPSWNYHIGLSRDPEHRMNNRSFCSFEFVKGMASF